MDSIWQDKKIRKFPKLSQNEQCDVLIIGGGIAGITTAYALKNQGLKVIVIEGKTLGSGVTSKTTAFVSSQHDLTYHRYLKTFGKYKTQQILLANEKAIQDIERIIESEKISCDFVKCSAFVFAKTPKGSRKIITEYLALQQLNYKAYLHHYGTVLGAKYQTALEFKNQARFHPLKYLEGLIEAFSKNNGIIYEQSPVTKILDHKAYCGNFYIESKKIVIASHNPIVKIKGLYFLKTHLDKSYVISYPREYLLDDLYNEIDSGRLTFRSYQQNIIVSGQSHVVGRSRKNHYCQLLKDTKKFDLKAKVVRFWSASDGITLDNLPYIGRFNLQDNDLFVITGFGKWGMTNSLIAARIISSLVLQKDDVLIPIYSPQRKIGFRSFKNLVYNLITMIWQYHFWFCKPQNKTCTHLHGKLMYNAEDQTYECPCHGSIFYQNGKIKDSPANRPLIKK